MKALGLHWNIIFWNMLAAGYVAYAFQDVRLFPAVSFVLAAIDIIVTTRTTEAASRHAQARVAEPGRPMRDFRGGNP